MPQSIFTTLCDICDDLDSLVRSLEPGPAQDRFSTLVQRLDEAIDRTVGLEQPVPQESDAGTAPSQAAPVDLIETVQAARIALQATPALAVTCTRRGRRS